MCKVWRQMKGEGFAVARCTILRLMHDLVLEGVICGKPVRATISDKAADCPLSQLNRQFHTPAPNKLWVSYFTYVATCAGFVYVAIVIDVYARCIVGWRVSRTAHARFVLDALEHLSTAADLFIVAELSTTATVAGNMYPSNMPTSSPRPGSNRRSKVLVTATTRP